MVVKKTKDDIMVELGEYLRCKQYNEAFALCRKVKEDQAKATPRQMLYIAAYALFGLGHVHQAERWVEEYGKATMYQVGYLYLSAYSELHKGRSEQALVYWTSILQLDPSQTFADQLIERLKLGEASILDQIKGPHNISHYLPSRIEEYPEIKRVHFISFLEPFMAYVKEHKWKKTLLALGLLALLSLVLVFKTKLVFWIEEMTPYLLGNREKIILPLAPSGGTVLSPQQYDKDPPHFFYSSREELITHFKQARQQIQGGFVNQARALLGRLLLSNASFEIKQRVSLLRSAIPFLSREQFHDPVSIEQVLRQPYLYKGAQVFWSGSLRSLKPMTGGLEIKLVSRRKKDNQTMQLLVHYAVSAQAKEDMLARLSSHLSEVWVFGRFVGLERQAMRVKTRKLFFSNEP